MRTIRIFVSSPGDAHFERARLSRVVERLNGEFQGVAKLEPIRWETEFYKAHDTFQAQIPEAAQCDIVIAIFRARLGTELPETFPPMAEGRPYPSGTAYEVLSAIAASRSQGFPDVYVFRYPEPPSVKLEDPERAAIEAQWGRLKGFFDTWFTSPSGQFLAALQTFDSTDVFESQIETLLRRWLEEKVLLGRAVVWPAEIKGSPFRGLAAFGAKHSAVFFGRSRDVARSVDRIKDAAEKGLPFLLLNGASGSGKSSLARAGLIPRLTAAGVVPSVDAWRVASMRVGEVAGDPILALARRLFDREDDLSDDDRGRAPALPELAATDFRTPEDLAGLLRHADATALRPILGTLDAIGRELRQREGYQREVRADLVLLVDQLDDLFSADTSAETRTKFVTLLEAMAKTGRIWIVATLRADLYERLLGEPGLRAMKEAGASYDLAPPDAAELAEIVRAPAMAANLTYETDRDSGTSLDEILLRDADRPDLLPLLQFTLNQLFAARESAGDKTLLTLKAYRELGGLEGALDREGERAIAGLSEAEQAKLPRLLRQLAIPARAGTATQRTTLDIRSVPRGEAAYDEASAKLVRALVDARILLTSGEAAESTVRLAHARVLESWARARKIVAENADFYRVRSEVEAQRERWQKAGKSRDLLVGGGLPLAEAESIVKGFGDELPGETKEYVKLSGSRARLRQRLIAASAVIFAAVAGVAGWQWVEASRNAEAARVEKARAEANFNSAKQTVDGLIFDIAIGLGNLEGVRGEAVQKILETVRKTIDDLVATAPNDTDLQRSKGAMLLRFADIYSRTGDSKRALEILQECLALTRRLLAINPNVPLWQRDEVVILERIAILAKQMGDTDGARRGHEDSLKLLRKLIEQNPNSTDLQRDLMISLKKIGDFKLAAGDAAGALADFQEALRVIRALVARDATQNEWQNDLVDTLVSLSDAQSGGGDSASAAASLDEALEISRLLIVRDPTNIKWQRDRTLALERRADIKLFASDGAGALALYEEGNQINRRLVALDPNDLPRQRDLATSFAKMAGAKMMLNDLPGAQALFDESLALIRKIAARDPDNAQSQRDLAKAMQQAGFIRYYQQNMTEAEVLYRESLEITRRVAARDPNNMELKRDLAMGIRRIGDVRIKQGDDRGALPSLMESLEIVREVAARDRGDGMWVRDLVLGLSITGDARQRTGDRAGAHALYRERIVLIRKLLARARPQNDLLDGIFNLYNLALTGEDAGEKRAWLTEAMGYLVELETIGPIDQRLKVIRGALEEQVGKL